MYDRLIVLDRFKRLYSHGLRNGKSSEAAADDAIKEVRSETLAKLKEVYPSKTEDERGKIWEDIYSILVEWQGALINIPIDRTRLPLPRNPTENPDKIKDAALEEIKKTNVQEEVMIALENHFRTELDDITRQELWGDVNEFLIKWKLYLKSLADSKVTPQQ